MPPDFNPKANALIDLLGEEYEVQPHPQVPRFPFRLEGGRARVYKLLRKEEGRHYALKEIFEEYRQEQPDRFIASHANLNDVNLNGIEYKGLRAAERQIIRPTDPDALKHPNLACAMLMPWIQGKTWSGVLAQATRDDGDYPDLPIAIRLCDRFLEVMEGLEKAGMAHTDISPRNVIVQFNPIDVQLVDLEDMYIPGAKAPSPPNPGSTGYRHRSVKETCWGAEGDRFAAAVLAAEMVILANPVLARQATDEGFFREHCETAEGMARFRDAHAWLGEVTPEFAKVFKKSWDARPLKNCTRISRLRAEINNDRTVKVPELVGLKIEKARERLAFANLEVRRTDVASDDVLKGIIIKQEPGAGTKIERGSLVHIWVSSVRPSPPPQPLEEVPKLFGLKYSDACVRLEKAGLKPSGPNEVVSRVPKGRICNLRPEAGTKVQRGSFVHVTVSSGWDDDGPIEDSEDPVVQRFKRRRTRMLIVSIVTAMLLVTAAFAWIIASLP